jgi:hypothetical protein
MRTEDVSQDRRTWLNLLQLANIHVRRVRRDRAGKTRFFRGEIPITHPRAECSQFPLKSPQRLGMVRLYYPNFFLEIPHAGAARGCL